MTNIFTLEPATEEGIVLQTNHYYPFGMSYATNAQSSIDQPWRFGGKELMCDASLNLYDFEARLYSPVTGRFVQVDPMAEKYYGMSLYGYCAENPVCFIDQNGNDIVISGNLRDQALSQLQSKMKDKIKLELDNESGQVSYTVMNNKKLCGAAKQMAKMIDNHSIMVNLRTTNATQTDEGNLFIGGAFLGNTVSSGSNDNINVVANQLVNPIVLGRADEHTNTMGKMMMHEVTEAYFGAKLSQKTGISASAANKVDADDPYSFNNRAHSKATPQTPVEQLMYDSSGRSTSDISKANRVEWVVRRRGIPCIIQSLP